MLILIWIIGSSVDLPEAPTPTAPPVTDPQLDQEEILAEPGRLTTELTDLWSRQRQLDESTRSYLLAYCTDLSFQREQCFTTIASNLYAVRMVLQANRVTIRRIRSHDSTGRAREAGDALIRTVEVHNRADVGTEEALEKLAGQHNLTSAVESAISRLGTQDSPFSDFIDKWSN